MKGLNLDCKMVFGSDVKPEWNLSFHWDGLCYSEVAIDLLKSYNNLRNWMSCQNGLEGELSKLDYLISHLKES